ncbi:hypothetical protein WAI453_001907 [Rhynchosporium graminicola]
MNAKGRYTDTKTQHSLGIDTDTKTYHYSNTQHRTFTHLRTGQAAGQGTTGDGRRRRSTEYRYSRVCCLKNDAQAAFDDGHFLLHLLDLRVHLLPRASTEEGHTVPFLTTGNCQATDDDLQCCQAGLALFEELPHIALGSFEDEHVEALAPLRKLLHLAHHESSIVNFILHCTESLMALPVCTTNVPISMQPAMTERGSICFVAGCLNLLCRFATRS